jgi:hypothetical protein
MCRVAIGGDSRNVPPLEVILSEDPSMPPITFDGRSLLIAGRRTTLVGAGCEYSMLPRAERADRLRGLSHLGCNTVVASCPWFLHEPISGHLDFDGDLNISEFLTEAHAAGLRVILRIGPVIGAPFDGGGLPTWLGDRPEIASRTGTPEFLKLASAWFGRIAAEITDHQADRDSGGSLVGVQVEHGWNCGSKSSADKYLIELVRYARECGITVPILTANGFWQETEGAIETWNGWDDLFSNLRQVSSLQPGKPRFCLLERSPADAFRRPGIERVAPVPGDLAGRLVRVLAAGAQPMIAHAVEGILPAGAAGRDDFGTIAPNAFASPLLDGSGAATDLGREASRILRFARDFGGVLADLDPDDQPMVVDPDDACAGVVAVPRSGGAGTAIFFFRRGDSEATHVIDRTGRRIPIRFGDHDFTWTLLDADLQGAGRLDFVTAMPLALIAGRMLVVSAPPGEAVELSIDDRAFSTSAPRNRQDGSGPIIEQHAGFTIVVLNEHQAATLIDDGDSIIIGATRVGSDGSVVPFDDMLPIRIATDGTRSRPATTETTGRGIRRIKNWFSWEEPDCWKMDHPRSIPVDGDLGLASIGAGLDHAWFTAETKFSKSSKADQEYRLLGGLRSGDFWLDGRKMNHVDEARISMPAIHGAHQIAIFARHAPRMVDGIRSPGDGDRPGSLVAIDTLKDVQSSKVHVDPIDPFLLHPFIPGAADGELTSEEGLQFAFTHRRKTPVVLEIAAGSAGVILLNDTPIDVFGRTGYRRAFSASIDEAFKAGGNRFQIMPLEHVTEESVEIKAELFEVVEEIVPAGAWRIRRWETTPDPRIGDWVPIVAAPMAAPRWLRSEFKVPAARRKQVQPGRLRLEGVTRGRAKVNGIDLGGYALREPGGRTARGAASIELPIPANAFLGEGPIELLLFDEAGADPSRVTIDF